MKKIIISVLFFISVAAFIFCDETTDNDSLSESKIKFRDKAEYFMKFRGSASFGFAYYFGVNDGVNNGNHTGNVSYTPLDYTDNGDPSNNHHTINNEGRIIGNTWGGVELKLYANYDFIAPFLTADHFLFSGNNIKMSFFGGLSPISMEGGMGITFTPIAFLNFQAGLKIGSGWDLAGLFNGLGRNIDGEVKSEPFYGTVLQIWFSTTFQFDIAAIMPKSYKRWTHIVMAATPKIRYISLLNVSENQPYRWEAGRGEFFNGWSFLGNFFLGYQIPVIEDDIGEDRQFIKMKHNNFKITAGMLVTLDYLNLSHFFDSQMSDGWGSDFCYVEFGPLVNFDLPNNFFVTVLFLWRNDRGYTSETVGNLDFQQREYEDWYVYFRRFAFSFGIKF